jgi:hypothetical protein
MGEWMVGRMDGGREVSKAGCLPFESIHGEGGKLVPSLPLLLSLSVHARAEFGINLSRNSEFQYN